MAVFVLVHGAWGGAHGFRKVRGPLREAGHEVFTPSLTGIGERAHLTSPQVSLTTHIADVVNAVWYEDLSDIVLLGYSSTWTPSCPATVTRWPAWAAQRPKAAWRPWAATGWCRRFPVSTTTRPRRRGPDRGARRTRPAVSPSRSGWRARWRTTRSPAPTSRPPASPGPMAAGRSGPPRTGPWPRRPGATGR